MVRTDRTLDEVGALVERCAREGDKDGLLLALLEVWARHRGPELAAAIELHTQLAQRDPLPLQTEQDWLELAQGRDPRKLSALLAAPWQALGERILRRRLAELAHFPADPRVAAFAREIEAWAHQADSAPLSAMAQRIQQFHGLSDGDMPPDPRVQAIVAAATLARASVEDGLLQAVFDAPDEDTPRLVYADFLMERGEPLGRYIAASLDPRSPPVALTREQRGSWCRSLLGGVDPDTVELRRGFPYQIRLAGQGAGASPTKWASLEEVVWMTDQPPDLADLARARSLKALHFPPVDGLQRPWLPDVPSLLEGLGLREVSFSVHAWGKADRLARHWPKLERIGLWLPPHRDLHEGFLGGMGQRPMEIRLFSPNARPGQLVAVALKVTRGCARGVTCVRVGAPGEMPDVRRGDIEVLFEQASAFRELRLMGPDAQNMGLLGQLIHQVPPEALDGIVVETPLWEDMAFLKRLRSALKRFRALPLQLLPLSGRASG